MVERLKQGGYFIQFQWSVEDLCEDGASWSAQDFRQAGVTPSGPGSFSCSFWGPVAHYLHWSGVQVWGRWGLLEVLMMFFQTCNRTHSDRLPVVDFPQYWGMVSCSWWYLSDLSTLKPCHWKRIGSLAYRNNLPLWSPFPVCIWPVYTRICSHSCEHLLWPDGTVRVLQWTMVCHCFRLNEYW